MYIWNGMTDVLYVNLREEVMRVGNAIKNPDKVFWSGVSGFT